MVGSQTALKAIWAALLKQPPEAAFLIGGAHGMVHTRTAEFAFERDSFLLLARSERAAPALHRRFLDRGSSGANVGRRRLAAGRTAAGAAGRVGSLRRPSRVGGAGAVAIHMGRVRGSRTQADEAAPTQSSVGLTIAVRVCDGTVVRGGMVGPWSHNVRQKGHRKVCGGLPILPSADVLSFSRHGVHAQRISW